MSQNNQTTLDGVESNTLSWEESFQSSWEDSFQSVALTDVPVVSEGTGEDRAYLELLALFNEYYPDLSLNEQLVEIPIDKNGVRHYFGRHSFDNSYKEELNLKNFPIKDAIKIPACGYCVADPSSTELASRIIDSEISKILQCALSLREMKPLDHDIDKIIDGVVDLKAHINLCIEFQAYESSVEESVNDILNGTVGGDYNEKIHQECDRIIEEVSKLADLTIRCDKLKKRSKDDLLKKYQSKNLSENNVKIVLAPLFSSLIEQTELEEKDVAILANLVYSNKRNSWSAELVELPHWIGELIEKDQGRAALSRLYKQDELDPNILEAALVFWKPDRYEPSSMPFDTAIEVAKRV
jgi:hypothetical protein